MNKFIIIIFLLNFFITFMDADIEQKPRIIGGVTATPTQFPWVVQIRVKSNLLDFVGRKWCAGSILTVNWVITAAHCATLLNNRYLILAGASDAYIPNTSTIQERMVVAKRIHHKYNPRNGDSDIALMRVYPPFAFDNSTVGSIPYAHFNFIANGTATAAGWGARDETDPLGPRFLQVGQIGLLNNTACQGIFPNRTILPTQICGSGFSSTPCYGDDGGPLMCSRNVTRVLCGIVAETKGCKRGLPPKIFTRTSPFYDWIQVGTTI